MSDKVITNIIIAGLGGQGVLKCSDILGEAVFRAGYDIKKAEVHGMSQRGGSVACDVRFSRDVDQKVLSPMVSAGQADYLLILSEDQIDNNKHYLREDGTMLTSSSVDASELENARSLNVALLGVLSRRLDIAVELWHDAIRSQLPEKLHDVNIAAFEFGRNN